MFIFLGGPPGPSNTRDDKGKGNRSNEGGCRTDAFFITLDKPIAREYSGRDEYEDVSVQQGLFMEPLPFPLSSRAKPRDLQFPRTFRGNVLRQSAA